MKKENSVSQQAAQAAAPEAISANVAVSDNNSGLGLVKIHDNVLASLVSRAVLGVAGVSRLAGSAFIDMIAGTVGSHSRAISIIKNPENADRLEIEVKVNLLFGSKVPEVATAIQRSVISQVEDATGITVSAVNVLVQTLEEPKAAATEADTEADAAAAAEAAIFPAQPL